MNDLTCVYCRRTGPEDTFEQINGRNYACRNQGACLVRQWDTGDPRLTGPARMIRFGRVLADVGERNERGDITETQAAQAGREVARLLAGLYADEPGSGPAVSLRPAPEPATGTQPGSAAMASQLRASLITHLASHGTTFQHPEAPGMTLSDLADLDPCKNSPRMPGGSPSSDMGRDADGYRVRRTDRMDFRVSECCGKDATTADGTDECVIVCRRCKTPIDEAIGARPRPPYIGVSGKVTAATRLGWS